MPVCSTCGHDCFEYRVSYVWGHPIITCIPCAECRVGGGDA